MPTDLMFLLTPKNLILFVAIFTRMGGLLVAAPLFSTYPIPNQVKAWLVATITFVIYPFIVAKTGFQAPTSMPELVVILLKEFMIGYIIGFLAKIIFIAIEIAAEIVSIQMGLSMAQALNPVSGDNAPVIGQAYAFIASLLFLGMNAHQQLFTAVYKSFQTVPIGYDFIVNGFVVRQIIYLSGQIFSIGFSIALPIFAILLLTDFLLGFTAKMMPQMNIFMVALPLKVYLGLLLVLMLIRNTTEYMTVLIQKMMGLIGGIF